MASSSNRSRADEHGARGAHVVHHGSAEAERAGEQDARGRLRKHQLEPGVPQLMRKSCKAVASLIHSHSNLRGSKGSTEWLSHIRELLKGTYTMTRVLTKTRCAICCHSDGHQFDKRCGRRDDALGARPSSNNSWSACGSSTSLSAFWSTCTRAELRRRRALREGQVADAHVHSQGTAPVEGLVPQTLPRTHHEGQSS